MLNMIDFYLKEFKGNESIFNPYTAPHKYRFKVYKNAGKEDQILQAWNLKKNKVGEEFIDKLEEIYNRDEKFLLFNPASNTKIFINDIIRIILEKFPQAIDLTHCFEKNAEVNFGDKEYENYTIEELSEYIEIDKHRLSELDMNIEKAFIIDDVYNSGKSIELTEFLITENLQNEIEINCGVILKVN